MNLTSAPSFNRARRVSQAVSLLSAVLMWLVVAAAVAGSIALLFFFDHIRDIVTTKADVILNSGELPPAKIPEVQTALASLAGLAFGKRLGLTAILVLNIAPLFLSYFICVRYLRALRTAGYSRMKILVASA
jgi:hypothetical protein